LTSQLKFYEKQNATDNSNVVYLYFKTTRNEIREQGNFPEFNNRVGALEDLVFGTLDCKVFGNRKKLYKLEIWIGKISIGPIDLQNVIRIPGTLPPL